MEKHITTHQLAKQLLEGPDIPVAVASDMSDDEVKSVETPATFVSKGVSRENPEETLEILVITPQSFQPEEDDEPHPEAIPGVIGQIGIDYDEPDAYTTYRGVRASTRSIRRKNNKERGKKFFTNDPSFDYGCAMLWLAEQRCERVVSSSSCDHFVTDGGELDLDDPNLKERLKAYYQEKLEREGEG